MFLCCGKTFHLHLLFKLKKIGQSDTSISWFESYLDRTQQLTYNDVMSDRVPVWSGIGQGTIVGPIIFLLYINDVVSMLPGVHINMYADNCTQLGIIGFMFTIVCRPIYSLSTFGVKMIIWF